MDWQKTMPSTYQKPTAPLDLTAVSEAKFSRLKWRMLCKGQLDMELIDYLCVENEKDFIPGRMVGK